MAEVPQAGATPVFCVSTVGLTTLSPVSTPQQLVETLLMSDSITRYCPGPITIPVRSSTPLPKIDASYSMYSELIGEVALTLIETDTKIPM